MTHNENSRVKIPAILHLMRLGYDYLSLKNENWDKPTNIFPEIFIESLCRINLDLSPDDARRLLADIRLELVGAKVLRTPHQSIRRQETNQLPKFQQ